MSAKPLEEPVAWYGPIVMNTQEQLRQAFRKLEQGSLLEVQEKRHRHRRVGAPPMLRPIT